MMVQRRLVLSRPLQVLLAEATHARVHMHLACAKYPARLQGQSVRQSASESWRGGGSPLLRSLQPPCQWPLRF